MVKTTQRQGKDDKRNSQIGKLQREQSEIMVELKDNPQLVKEKSILKEKVTYKLQVWDIKSVGPEIGELKNSLTFDVSE